MELTKDALRDVSFRARGKWYRGEDVDGFLAELMVALDEAEREKQELEDDVRRLKQHLTETLQAPSHQELVCAELEKERDELIESIKLLRRFREEFRNKVQGDAEELLQNIQRLPSDQLL